MSLTTPAISYPLLLSLERKARMKRTIVILAVMTLALGLWPQTALAQPKPQVTPFTAIEISCSETPGDETTEGDITHHRGQLEETVWFSEEPLANALVHEVINWNYYASIDQGHYTGTMVVQPIDKAGAFEGAFSGYWVGEDGSFVGSSLGTGELAGMEFFATGYPLAVDVALALIQDDPRVVDGNPCAPGPMPDIGEASVIYGYFVNRSAQMTAGAAVEGAQANYIVVGSVKPVLLSLGGGGEDAEWTEYACKGHLARR